MTTTKLYPVTVTWGGVTKRKRFAVITRGGDHDGLTVFDQPDKPWFHTAVDWANLDVPATLDRRKAGFGIPLPDGGTVQVQVSGCATCGSLSRWAGPAWANGVGG